MKKYQIRIFKTEIIEIFQNVIFHECKFEGSFIVSVHIECSKTDGIKHIYDRNSSTIFHKVVSMLQEDHSIYISSWVQILQQV